MVSALPFAAVLFLKGEEDWARVTGWKADLREKMGVAIFERGSEQKKKKNHKNVVELSLEAKLNGRQEQ